MLLKSGDPTQRFKDRKRRKITNDDGVFRIRGRGVHWWTLELISHLKSTSDSITESFITCNVGLYRSKPVPV